MSEPNERDKTVAEDVMTCVYLDDFDHLRSNDDKAEKIIAAYRDEIEAQSAPPEAREDEARYHEDLPDAKASAQDARKLAEKDGDTVLMALLNAQDCVYRETTGISETAKWIETARREYEELARLSCPADAGSRSIAELLVARGYVQTDDLARVEHVLCHARPADAAVRALRAQINWRMRDGTPCCCPAGRNEDEPKGKMPTVHSTACEMLRAALAQAEGEEEEK